MVILLESKNTHNSSKTQSGKVCFLISKTETFHFYLDEDLLFKFVDIIFDSVKFSIKW